MSDTRPVLVVIANAAAPYRVHVQRRIAREMPEYRLVTIFTHETGASPWAMDMPAEINAMLFGVGESTERQGRLSGALSDWRKAGRIIQWMKGRKIAAVVVVTYNDPGRLRLIRWLHARRIPVFLFGDSNIRCDHAAGLKLLLKKIWLGFILRRCDAVLPCGRLGREFFIRYGANPHQIHFFPYEPDYDLIESISQDRIGMVREKYGLSPDRRRLIFSGRLAPEKRVDLLIDTFTQIAAQRPDWDLILAGDGPLRDELEKRIPNNLRQRVRFMGFINDAAELIALYKTCDALVLPSDYEPWALVINEAAAAGLAIVASDVVGAAYELVRPDVNGLTFERGNLHDLQKSLSAVTHPDAINRLKSASPIVLQAWREQADPVVNLKQRLSERQHQS